MDLNVFDLASPAEAGATFNIRHPVTLEETDVTVTIVGKDSPTYRNCIKRLANIELSKDGEKRAAELESLEAQLLASAIRGWSGLTENGKELPFSYDKAVEILSNPAFNSLASQINEKINDRTLFFSK